MRSPSASTPRLAALSKRPLLLQSSTRWEHHATSTRDAATVQPQAGGCVRPQAASSPPQFLGCVRHHGRPSHHLPPRLRTSRGRTRRSSGFTASTPLLPQHVSVFSSSSSSRRDCVFSCSTILARTELCHSRSAVAVPAVTMARVPHISSDPIPSPPSLTPPFNLGLP